MNSLVIGLGEIGSAVRDVTDSAYSHDIAVSDKRPKKSTPIDVMHICFPYTLEFIKAVQQYILRYQPKYIVVWSTVPIGTCRLIEERVVHSPVEGTHPDLYRSIKLAHRWVGFNNGDAGRFFSKYFAEDLELEVSIVANTETTELVKLRSTAKFGINLAWAQYEAELCDQFGVSYEQIMDFDRDYNELYRKLDPYMQRYILYPPNGKIGGHCVVDNAKMLQSQAPSEFLEKIISMGKK